MNEINENKRVVIIPGRYFNGNAAMYQIENTIIAGQSRTNVTTALNGILTEMVIQHSPTVLSLEFYESKEYPSIWSTCAKKPWCMRSQPENVNNILKRLKVIKQYFEFGGAYNQNLHRDCIRVIALHNVDLLIREYGEEFKETLKYLVEWGPTFNFYFICTTADVFAVKEILPYFRMRLGSSLDNKSSEEFMGCNICTHEEVFSGAIWMYDIKSIDFYQRLKVNFYPDTFLSKLMKLFHIKGNLTKDDYELFHEERYHE